MAESINQRLAKLSEKSDARELRAILQGVLEENTVLRTSITSITSKLDALGAKLNADSGVNDTDYDEDFAATCNPPDPVIGK